VRNLPPGVFDGVTGVIHLAALSNDPTAEYDPEANWELNALATETLGRACLAAGVARLVFASSCSVYDGLSGEVHDERAPVVPRGAYATSKRYAEERLLEMADEGLCPVVLRFGTVCGHSPRMRFDLVVNAFLRDALLHGSVRLHEGGWMRRPMLEIGDAADVTVAALEAPSEGVRGEVFNVLEANHAVADLARAVARAVRKLGRPVQVETVPSLTEPRDYACANHKLADRLGLKPRRDPAQAVDGILRAIDVDDRDMLSHPRHHNIDWLQLATGRS